jgi:hypothetical protein
MERTLSPVVVVADAQPRRSGFLNDHPTQRLDLGRLALARRVAAPLTGAGHRLKRPANKLDRALHAGAILFRPALPRQFHGVSHRDLYVYAWTGAYADARPCRRL